MMASKEHLNLVESNFKDRVENNFSILSRRLDAIGLKFIENAAVQRRSFFKEMDIRHLSQDATEGTMEEIREWRNGTLLWKIENVKQKMETEAYVESPPFYSSQCGYKLRAEIYFSNTRCVSRVAPVPGDYDSLLPSGFYFRFTCSILDRSDSGERRDIISTCEPFFCEGEEAWRDTCSMYCFYGHLTIACAENLNAYLRNDAMYVKIVVEPMSCVFRDCFSRNGVLLWTIHDWSRTKLESVTCITHEIFSDYFYSSERGNRLRASISMIHNFIYFQIFFLRGEYDDELTATITIKCAVFFVNQTDLSGGSDYFAGTGNRDLYIQFKDVERLVIQDKMILRLVVE